MVFARAWPDLIWIGNNIVDINMLVNQSNFGMHLTILHLTRQLHIQKICDSLRVPPFCVSSRIIWQDSGAFRWHLGANPLKWHHVWRTHWSWLLQIWLRFITLSTGVSKLRGFWFQRRSIVLVLNICHNFPDVPWLLSVNFYIKLFSVLIYDLKLLLEHGFVSLFHLFIDVFFGALLLLIKTNSLLFFLLKYLECRNLIWPISFIRVLRLHFLREIFKFKLRLDSHDLRYCVHLLSFPVKFLHIWIYILWINLIEHYLIFIHLSALILWA